MGSDDRDHRVLIFAPIGRDAQASADLLRRSDISASVCAGLAELIAAVGVGAAAVFLSEEGLFGKDIGALVAEVERQPTWSDLPFIILTSHQEQPAVLAWRQKLVLALRNVSLLERPIQPISLTSTVRSALRARARQYEVRQLIAARDRAAHELEQLVAERTRELEEANAQLRTEMAERARVEDNLRQAQKIEAIGQLTGGIAHDFNNLLMVISGGLQMIDRQNDPARRRRVMEGMQQATQRGASLTRQLLAFSRKQALKPEPVDIARQIEGMRELLDRSLRGDVHVEIDFAPGLWPVEVDAGELELVVLNLAVNARDAMPNGGVVSVSAVNAPAFHDDELDGDFVRLMIADTGTGMTPEVKSRVFEPFYTTKEVGKGSGLGLAQVHGFARQSGGAVRIESAPGQGTRITLYLPRSTKEPAAEPRGLADVTRESVARSSAGNVLLVEDDTEVAALVTQMLEQIGYSVTHAATAAAALGALANGRPVDVVFSDVMMPGGMNGVELAREIRRRRLDLPVLLTSGYSGATKDAAAAEGVTILAKPFRIEELQAALTSVGSR